MIGSQWLWVVRLCFDRRAVVRIIALELIDIILRNSPEVHDPTVSEEEKGFGEIREADEEGEGEEEKGKGGGEEEGEEEGISFAIVV